MTLPIINISNQKMGFPHLVWEKSLSSPQVSGGFRQTNGSGFLRKLTSRSKKPGDSSGVHKLLTPEGFKGRLWNWRAKPEENRRRGREKKTLENHNLYHFLRQLDCWFWVKLMEIKSNGCFPGCYNSRHFFFWVVKTNGKTRVG